MCKYLFIVGFVLLTMIIGCKATEWQIAEQQSVIMDLSLECRDGNELSCKEKQEAVLKYKRMINKMR